MKTQEKVLCPLCPRACRLGEGEIGFCGARINRGGRTEPREWGLLSSLALDPIEKKPLAFFRPGTMILSAGFFGCNMRCPFCQNYHISMQAPDPREGVCYSPEELTDLALSLRPRGNVGLAFTYNEPLLAYEYIREVFTQARKAGLETVLVTNGNFMPEPLAELAPLVTAWNIDLKCFHEEGYRKLGGSFEHVKQAIRLAAATAHVEVTTLVVPGLSDAPEDMAREAAWLASLSPEIPLHLSRFFPRYKQTAGRPTDVKTLYKLREIAKNYLSNVVLGNV